ncbi:HPP family protein [Pseudomonas sp. Gutcm_11s]|uniref:HPP family protein n=1 Tax=Pseudomonas sp. Gutcm_11s TaxID=3026088 RepID=UPI00235E515D|nr:HPP family protein [Pseudomonas sp. Gutcm_11s]MDD0843486.1 HPP family protein [Pseudomonas sp. Gutcm_11s]
MNGKLKSWVAGFGPALAATHPREALRAATGCFMGMLITLLICQQLFPAPMLMYLFGPLAASSVLLFAVSSGALAQPWSFLGGYLVATLVAVSLGQWLGYSIPLACWAVGISVLLMCLLRCVHPPAGAVALCVHLSGVAVEQHGFGLVVPVMSAAASLLGCALIYNNLSGVSYPKRPGNPDLHHTRDPSAELRVGISDEDLEHALEDFGGIVDITRDDLARLVRTTERYALKRGMGRMVAEQIMSRDLRCVSPNTRREQALAMLRRHRLRSLPVLDDDKRLVGIVSLVDLISRPRGISPFLPWNLGKRVLVGQLMTSPVRYVESQAHVVELIPLLSTQGLHCLPVLDDGALVGIITQTDLIAALQRDLLEHVG